MIYLTCLIAVTGSLWQARARMPRPFNRSIPALSCASVLVVVRLVFRLAETAQGVFGFAMTHEAFFGTLEFLPILAALVLLAIWHPARPLRLLGLKPKGGSEAGEKA